MNLSHVGNERRASASATRGLPGLDWLNFFVANFQTGFGPFISVYLTSAGWTQGAIGAALSTGTAGGLGTATIAATSLGGAALVTGGVVGGYAGAGGFSSGTTPAPHTKKAATTDM